MSLYVVSDMDGSEHTLRRTSYDLLRIENQCFRKATFPLLLGYAMTVHRAQGATLRSPVLVYIRNAFAPALAYVALSRVDSVSRLRIVKEFFYSGYVHSGGDYLNPSQLPRAHPTPPRLCGCSPIYSTLSNSSPRSSRGSGTKRIRIGNKRFQLLNM